MELLLGLIIGLLIGAAGAWYLGKSQEKQVDDQMEERLRAIFNSVSSQALKENTEQFFSLAENKFKDHLKMGGKELEGKKALIDQNIEKMNKYLRDVEGKMTEIDKARREDYGKLGERLTKAAEVTRDLQEATQGLQKALSGKQSRGQWGERMAEDVLRLSGLLEGINYIKQTKLDQSDGRPDFTFMLPGELTVNMDVKFPFSNYERYVNAENQTEREKFKKEFVKDVKLRMKELESRDYINPQENTVDYMLLFIPNEQVYAFIQEIESDLVEEALRKKIILCSPLTLYAILAVIRQSIDNFAMESKSKDMLGLFGAFKEQWIKFKDSLEKVRTRFDGVHKEYEHLLGTRTNQLERPLKKIEALRVQKNIEPSLLSEAQEIVQEEQYVQV